ncbi:ATP-binding protein [Sphaerisporangium sp. B11E5]|uniref:ATP-binding protein n=1 Tax=Sphaerisporangium sp. B11E5 TaxID=3153563 RepID=UPI00325E999E
MSVNPFALRGRDHPAGHLSPFPGKGSEESGLYVDVGGASARFARFTEEFTPPDAAAGRGRLVVVTGDSGSGKTSLVDRCVDWLGRAAAERGWQAPAVDLREAEAVALGTADRVRLVFRRLVASLAEEGAVPRRWVEELRVHEDDPPSGYRALGRVVLEQRRFAVVLLPSCELPMELREYARLATPGVVLFLESSYPEVEREAESPPSEGRVLHLRMGRLGADDVRRFVEQRLRGRPPGTVPEISDEAMEAVVRTAPHLATVRQVQMLLHEMFDRAIAESRTTVTYRDFLEYWNAKDLTR